MYWEELSWSPLAKEPGRAAWKYDTDVQNRADDIPTLLDVLERSVVESAGLDWRVQSHMTTLSSWHERPLSWLRHSTEMRWSRHTSVMSGHRQLCVVRWRRHACVVR